jgi:hypothetical protein
MNTYAEKICDIFEDDEIESAFDVSITWWAVGLATTI